MVLFSGHPDCPPLPTFERLPSSPFLGCGPSQAARRRREAKSAALALSNEERRALARAARRRVKNTAKAMATLARPPAASPSTGLKSAAGGPLGLGGVDDFSEVCGEGNSTDYPELSAALALDDGGGMAIVWRLTSTALEQVGALPSARTAPRGGVRST